MSDRGAPIHGLAVYEVPLTRIVIRTLPVFAMTTRLGFHCP